MEETASKIQDGKRVGLPQKEIEAFVLDYQRWHANCLDELPSAKKDDFENEYDDRMFPKIRQFLTAPTSLWDEPGEFNRFVAMNDLLRYQTTRLQELRMGEMQASFSESPLHHYWKYPYKETFYPHFLEQRRILIDASKYQSRVQASEYRVFDSREFHLEVKECSRSLFGRGAYESAVFESNKAFIIYVQKKSNTHSGMPASNLMEKDLSQKGGSLRLNSLQALAQRDEQEGLKLLCMGLVKAIRNQGGHEPARDRSMSREDALDILSLISFLFRQIDKTSYVGTK